MTAFDDLTRQQMVWNLEKTFHLVILADFDQPGVLGRNIGASVLNVINTGNFMVVGRVAAESPVVIRPGRTSDSSK